VKAFFELSLEDQATIVLLSLLEDVANEKRTMAGVEHHVHDLYSLLSKHFDVPSQEVDMIVQAVAHRGIEMLPGYVLEDPDAEIAEAAGAEASPTG
jgi:hypothetical protein